MIIVNWLKRLVGLFLILSNLAIFAQHQEKDSELEIPEVYVYGERAIKLVPYKKKIFPFVKVYDYPSIFVGKKSLRFTKFKNPFIEKTNVRYRIFTYLGNTSGISIDGATEYFYYPSRFNITGVYGSRYEDEKWKVKAGGRIYLPYISPYISYFHNVTSDTFSRHFINIGSSVSIPYLKLGINLGYTKVKTNDIYLRLNADFQYENFILKMHSVYLTNIPFFVSLLPEWSFRNITGGIYLSRYLIFPAFNFYYTISGYTLGFSISPEIQYQPLGYYMKDAPFLTSHNPVDSIIGGNIIKGIFGIRDRNLIISYYYNYNFPYIDNDTLKAVKLSCFNIGFSGNYKIKNIYLYGEIGYFLPKNDTITNFNKLCINFKEKWSYLSLSQKILYRKVDTTNYIIPLLGIEMEYPFRNLNFILKAGNILNRTTPFWGNHQLSGIFFYSGITYKFQE